MLIRLLDWVRVDGMGEGAGTLSLWLTDARQTLTLMVQGIFSVSNIKLSEPRAFKEAGSSVMSMKDKINIDFCFQLVIRFIENDKKMHELAITSYQQQNAHVVAWRCCRCAQNVCVMSCCDVSGARSCST